MDNYGDDVTNNFITGTKINGDGLMNQNGNSYNRMMDFNNIIIGITSNASNRN